jgi:hypothetical protein
MPLSGDKPRDLRNRMRGQFLGDLGSDAIGDLRVKGLAKIAQYFWRSDNDKPIEKIGMSVAIECFRKLIGKRSAASLDGILLLRNSVQNIPNITRKPPRGFPDAARCAKQVPRARSQQRAMS